jgi:hypothetical protein
MVSRWTKWTRRAALAVVALVLLVGSWRLALAELISSRIAEIREKGYPVTLVELNRWYPHVAPLDNGAPLLDEAFSCYSQKPAQTGEPRDDPFPDASRLGPAPDPRSQTIACSPDSNNDDALALLQQASNAARWRFPIDLRTLSILPYPHLGNLIRAAHLLEADAANHAAHAEAQPAIASVQSLFGLSHSLDKEPLVRSHLARLECQRIALNSLQNLLNGTGLTEKQLDTLADALGRAEDQRGLARAFIGQRCIGIYSFEMLERMMDPVTLPAARSYPFGKRFLVNLDVLVSSPGCLGNLFGLLQCDELEYLRLMDRCVRAAQMDFPERIDATQALRESLDRQNEFHTFSMGWMRGMNGPRVILKDAALAARLREARLAVAVERYRLAHNELPHSLRELGSARTDAVPADPFNGRPLQYTRLANGYVIRSVCQNIANKDDGTGLREAAFMVER